MNIEESLGKKILNAYRRTIFSKISKSEIDLIVFGALIKIYLKDEADIFQGENINWLKISSEHIRKLSLSLMITETRVSNLIEQCALMEWKQKESDELVLAEMKNLLTKTRQNAKDIAEGILQIYVPNKFTRTAIEAFLTKDGGIPDTSFNRNHLKIRLVDLLKSLRNKDKDNHEMLLELAKKANKESKDTEFNKIINTAEQKTGIEKTKLLTSAIIKPFLGKGGEFIADNFFDFISQING
jgi:hypothetical protein